MRPGGARGMGATSGRSLGGGEVGGEDRFGGGEDGGEVGGEDG